MTKLNDDAFALLSKYPAILKQAEARARELAELDAQAEQDRRIEAELVPILGESEAALRTRERRQHIDARRASAEAAIRDGIALAKRQEAQAMDDAERARISAEKAATIKALVDRATAGAREYVIAIRELEKIVDFVEWRNIAGGIWAETRKSLGLANLETWLVAQVSHAKWI